MIQRNQTKIDLLVLESLSTGYPHHTVSQNLSARLEEGTVTALIGTNGCGKSTLLEAIAFGNTRKEGKITLAGEPIEKIKLNQRAKFISIVRSQLERSIQLTVEELVALGRSPYLNTLGKLSSRDRDIVRKSLLDCKLKGYEKRMISTLSDGERQRALIAMALAQETPLVLLDEPTSHLDLSFRIELFLLLREIAQKSQRTFLLATHEISLAMQWCDALWILDQEGNLSTGLPEELALQGKIATLFEKEHFHFDPYTGQVELLQRKQRAINLIGDGSERELWTRRLLTRLGYIAQKTSDPEQYTIEIFPNSWHFITTQSSFEVKTLSELQAILR